jgi:hypothetical protein
MLSNLQVGSRPILQICLLGQPEFRKTIVRPELDQLRQRVIASYHLGSLDTDDTEGYIQHRLLQAGWRGHPRFALDAVAAIHDHTGGIPRKINFLCDRLLLYGHLEDKERSGAADVEIIVREMSEEAVGIRSASTTGGEKADITPLNGRPVSKREFDALMERLESLEALLRSRAPSPVENEAAVPAEKSPSADEADGSHRRVAGLEKRLRQGAPFGS